MQKQTLKDGYLKCSMKDENNKDTQTVKKTHNQMCPIISQFARFTKTNINNFFAVFELLQKSLCHKLTFS